MAHPLVVLCLRSVMGTPRHCIGGVTHGSGFAHPVVMLPTAPWSSVLTPWCCIWPSRPTCMGRDPMVHLQTGPPFWVYITLPVGIHTWVVCGADRDVKLLRMPGAHTSYGRPADMLDTTRCCLMLWLQS